MAIESLQSEPRLAVFDLEDESDYQAFLTNEEEGLRFVPEPYRPGDAPSLISDSGDFAKWLRQEHPDLRISMPTNVPKVNLRSADILLPLVYLASDASVQVFLNMAANYLYDRAKGLLKNERSCIHLRAVYQDKVAGRTKRLEFSGDADALAKVIKKFDLNNFFDDAS